MLAFFVTRNACRSLARDKVHPFGGAVGSRVRRTAAGGYEPVDDEDPPKVGAVLIAEDNPYKAPPPASPTPRGSTPTGTT